jgi:hypothetical protein
MELTLILAALLLAWIYGLLRGDNKVAMNSEHLMHKYQLLQLSRKYKSSKYGQNNIVNKL